LGRNLGVIAIDMGTLVVKAGRLELNPRLNSPLARCQTKDVKANGENIDIKEALLRKPCSGSYPIHGLLFCLKRQVPRSYLSTRRA
jgi:hypothetical protein